MGFDCYCDHAVEAQCIRGNMIPFRLHGFRRFPCAMHRLISVTRRFLLKDASLKQYVARLLSVQRRKDDRSVDVIVVHRQGERLPRSLNTVKSCVLHSFS